MRRLLLRPTLLEFCRTHLIFTAPGALFTVPDGPGYHCVFHLGETIMKAAPPDWSNRLKNIAEARCLCSCLCCCVWPPISRQDG